MVYPTVTEAQDRRRRYASLRLALVRTVQQLAAEGTIPAVVRHVWEQVPRYARAEAGALVWTTCRWGELRTIDWGYTASEGRVWVSMPKVGEMRQAPRVPAASRTIWERVEHPVTLPMRSRRKVAEAIRQAIRSAELRAPRGIKSGTHAVRHLTASALAAEGEDVEEIATRLGHASTESTRQYIHPMQEWRPAS